MGPRRRGWAFFFFLLRANACIVGELVGLTVIYTAGRCGEGPLIHMPR